MALSKACLRVQSQTLPCASPASKYPRAQGAVKGAVDDFFKRIGLPVHVTYQVGIWAVMRGLGMGRNP